MTPCDNTPLDGPAQETGLPGNVEIGLLADAQRLLDDRGRQYGPPSDHHARTAEAVNAILGLEFTPRDVALFFVIDKLVRSRTTPGKRDSYADACGYLAIAYGHAVRETG